MPAEDFAARGDPAAQLRVPVAVAGHGERGHCVIVRIVRHELREPHRLRSIAAVCRPRMNRPSTVADGHAGGEASMLVLPPDQRSVSSTTSAAASASETADRRAAGET